MSTAQPEFDFWEFVECTKCHLPFVSESGATVPFWLTECGHVICNSHLNPDQSCHCGTTNVQVIPLQQELDPPMSEWFRSAPYALDTIAFAIKFQQESMASQIRYYKSRHHQQRMYIDKMRRENSQLKQEVDMLSMQLQQMNAGGYYVEEPSEMLNPHGKRRRVDSQRTSSPRSSHTPLGPNRLTLPPGHQPPQLMSKTSPEQPFPPLNSRAGPERPGTRGFADKFTYQTSASHVINHAQGQLYRNKQTDENGPGPPQALSKFKPAPQAPVNSSSRQPSHQKIMPPPPTPQRLRQPVNDAQPAISSNRFLPPEKRFPPPPPANVPSTANGSKRFVAPAPVSGSRAPSRAAATAHSNSASHGGQRMPFVPTTGHGSYG